MGLFVGYYDWDAPTNWERQERFLERVFVTGKRQPEYYAYQSGTKPPKIFIRPKLIKLPADKFALLGIYNCGGGRIDLPKALSEAVFFRDLLGGSFCFFDRENKFEDFKDVAIDVIKDVVAFLPGGEGFAFDLNGLSPEGYMAGEVAPKAGEREIDAVTKWIIDRRENVARVDCRLRDIFPLNVLSSALASRKVTSELTLREWIAQASERGTLSELGEDNILWEVAPNNIKKIRMALDPMGLIY